MAGLSDEIAILCHRATEDENTSQNDYTQVSNDWTRVENPMIMKESNSRNSISSVPIDGHGHKNSANCKDIEKCNTVLDETHRTYSNDIANVNETDELNHSNSTQYCTNNSDTSYRDDHANQDDIIIDGETEFDDFVVASRIAQIENYKLELNNHQFNHRWLRKNDAKYSVDYKGTVGDDESDVESETDDQIQEIINYKYRTGINCPSEISRIVHDTDQSDMSSDDACKLQIMRAAGGARKEVSASSTSAINSSDLVQAIEVNVIDRKNENKGGKENQKHLELELLMSEEDEAAEKEFQRTRKLPPEKWTEIQRIETIDIPLKVPDDNRIEYIGVLHAMISNMAIVLSDKVGVKPLDLGSVLCLEDRTIIGAISDTFGPITNPLYAIFLGDKCQLNLTSNDVGMKIYYDEKHSTVILDEIDNPDYLRAKRSDYIDEDTVDDDDSDDEMKSKREGYPKKELDSKSTFRPILEQTYEEAGVGNVLKSAIDFRAIANTNIEAPVDFINHFGIAKNSNKGEKHNRIADKRTGNVEQMKKRKTYNAIYRTIDKSKYNCMKNKHNQSTIFQLSNPKNSKDDSYFNNNHTVPTYTLAPWSDTYGGCRPRNSHIDTTFLLQQQITSSKYYSRSMSSIHDHQMPCISAPTTFHQSHYSSVSPINLNCHAPFPLNNFSNYSLYYSSSTPNYNNNSQLCLTNCNNHHGVQQLIHPYVQKNRSIPTINYLNQQMSYNQHNSIKKKRNSD